MSAIKPVSDLRNYNEVLSDVHEGSPVFLTKNGHSCYAVLDMKNHNRFCAIILRFTAFTRRYISTAPSTKSAITCKYCLPNKQVPI